MPTPLAAYTQPLTAQTAAHLLRRSTFGPTQAEITAFIGLTAQQAVGQLVSNVNYTTPPPIDLNETKTTFRQPYLSLPFDQDRNYELGQYVLYGWLAQMTSQTAPASLLEKLALFWQNHFVITRTVVGDYRFLFQYIQLIRTNALGNFRTLVTKMTKEPAMLVYLNGDQNQVGNPNENYGRELQELFVVGAVDFEGNKNYTEDDVKTVAKVLTGWGHTHHNETDSTSFTTTFTDSLHDATNKTFTDHYNNTVITGRAVSNPGTSSAGDAELTDLVNMLVQHPNCPKYICRKLYRWYVNSNITADIETNVITPLASFFASPANDFAIQPVIEKLLMSQVFFDSVNIGAVVKSPAELILGAMRFFNQPVPDRVTDSVAFRKYFEFVFYQMNDMQMGLVDQPSVLGYDACYQTGFSRLWINTSSIGLRGNLTDAYIWRWLEVKPGYNLGIDLIAWVTALQPNFTDVAGTPAITCATVMASFSKNLFTIDLFQSQTDFLIDTIMMQGVPRTDWLFEWNAYRRDITNPGSQYSVLWRLQNLMRYMLRMAEYHVC
ncbi:DUF1800 domain-containing protein [Spirosoma pollinicola]|uniref:DUF1800 domain-containing protein n=1 Tax=Spirosoma pollinicola TaxID=2057025 RepID=A0A2K8YU05_9BACT|nr:DUF1800 family protein [Spirosoma pollinicola]AUD01110.1 DUF1800 domain-containing protein [Spirosoma pollinicola]